MGFCFFCCHHSVRNNNDNIANLRPAGGRPIQANDARTAFSFNYVRNESFAVVIIHNMDLLILKQTGGIHQVFINRNTANVIKFGLGNFDAV